MLISWNIETCLAAEVVACFLLMALWNGLIIVVANENAINKPNSNSYRRSLCPYVKDINLILLALSSIA